MRRTSEFLVLTLCFIALLIGFVLPASAQGNHTALTPIASSEPIDLYPVVKASPGAEQAYLITGRIWEIEESIEPIPSAPLPKDQAIERAATYMLYRVLEPAADGTLRLEVYAQSLDPRTGAPLALPSWSDVMSVTPEGISFERGDAPAWSYVLTESPEWAGEWLSLAADLPQGPATPGAQWSSSQDMASLGLPMEFLIMSAYLDVDGTFLGWASDGEQTVAVVNERFQGEVTGGLSIFGLPPDCDAACLEAQADWLLHFGIGLEGESEIWLVPGDFPWGGRSTQTFEVYFDGEIPTTFAFGEVDILRFDGEVAPVSATLLENGETHNGALGPESLLRADDNMLIDAPTDLFSFVGVEGHQALITMTSQDLDPVLVLLDHVGDFITEVDAYFDDDRYIAELYMDLPYTGLYFVQATTQEHAALGEYALALETGPEIEYTPADDGWFGDDWWSLDDWDWGSSDEDGLDWDELDWDEFDWDDFDWDFFDWLGEDWESFDSDYSELEYTHCEALQSGAHPVNVIAPGTPVSQVLPPDTDISSCEALPHLYSFQGTAGTEILLQMVSSDFDAYLVLLDSAWNVLEVDDDNAGNIHPQIHTTLHETDTYFVLAGETWVYSFGEGGHYTLYLDQGEAVQDVLDRCGYPRSRTPSPIDTTGEFSNYFGTWDAPIGCESPFELFSFEASAGDTVVIDAISSDFDTVLVLADADLKTLVEDDDSGEQKSARIETTVDATGVYYVKVLGYWPYSYGYYTLKIAVNGLPPVPGDQLQDGLATESSVIDLVPRSPWELSASAMPDCYALWEENALYLTSSDSIYEDLNANEWTVYNTCATHLYSYSFDAEAGDDVLIELYADDPRAYAALYDADWQLIWESESEDWFAEIFTTLSATGQYFIVAGAYDSEYAPGSYTLYLDVGPGLFDQCWSPETPKLVPGELVTHERDIAGIPSYCNGLSDLYMFHGKAGETITLDMRSDEFVVYLGVYDTEFVPLGAAESSEEGEETNGASITLTVPSSGEYFVEANLTQWTEETAGTYTLWFGREQPGQSD